MIRNNNNNYQGNQGNTAAYAAKKRPLTEEEQAIYMKNIDTESPFAKLLAVPVWDKIEEKNGLSYLSWADAWAEVKKRYPLSTYKVYEDPSTGWNYFTDGKTAWVKVSVTVEDIEHIEYMPIKDYRNNSILIENITSMDVLNSIQRGLTKACARHGLGLTLYGAEEIGVVEQPGKTSQRQPKQAAASAQQTAQPAPKPAAAPATATVQQAAQAAPSPASQPAQKKEPPLERAKKLVLGFGEHQGKTLSEVFSADADYVRKISDANTFTPQNDEEVKAQVAAKYLLNNLAA